jgi:hypothetical protein
VWFPSFLNPPDDKATSLGKLALNEGIWNETEEASGNFGG